MVAAVIPYLPSSLRCRGGLVSLFFQIVWAKRIYGFSVNFLSFPTFFERGVFLKITTFSFAPLRLRVNHLQPHGAWRGLIYFTQRRKGAKKESLAPHHVRGDGWGLMGAVG
jgi:hypothetical protein